MLLTAAWWVAAPQLAPNSPHILGFELSCNPLPLSKWRHQSLVLWVSPLGSSQHGRCPLSERESEKNWSYSLFVTGIFWARGKISWMLLLSANGRLRRPSFHRPQGPGEDFLGRIFIQVQIEIGWLEYVFMGGHEESQGERKPTVGQPHKGQKMKLASRCSWWHHNQTQETRPSS